jgi:hypothetical protein
VLGRLPWFLKRGKEVVLLRRSVEPTRLADGAADAVDR